MYECNWQQGRDNHKSSRNHKSHRSNGNNGNNNNNGVEIRNLVGDFVRINRGGPESLEGKLLAVKSDYLVLCTREGVVYVDLEHVKSVTGFANGKSGGYCKEYINANSFKGVINALTKEFVQINWGGPERVQGFLAEVQGNTALVVVNNEVVYILVDHIKTIKQYGGNKTGGNKSGGNKTGGNQGGNQGGNKNKTGGQQTGGNKGNRTGAQAQGQSTTGSKSKKSGGSNRSRKG